MTQNTNQKHIIYLNTNSLYGNAMSKLLQQVDSNGEILNSVIWLSIRTGNSSNSYVSLKKANLEYSKELGKLHNSYSLAPDKMEIKKHVF